MGIPEAIGFSPCDRADMQYVRARVPSISQAARYIPQNTFRHMFRILVTWPSDRGYLQVHFEFSDARRHLSQSL